MLGANGMLGSAVLAALKHGGVTAVGSSRDGAGAAIAFEAREGDAGACIDAAGGATLVVNAIGCIKPLIDDADAESRRAAIAVNADFPHRLAAAAAERQVHVVQVETDCVYAGRSGPYAESSPHDPTDVYGRSKSLGEVPAANVTHLRCSLVGPEVGRRRSLWEWVAGLPPDAAITGFTDHLWNGLTSQAFGRICAGIARAEWRTPGTFHVVPADAVSKDELVRLIAVATGRSDLRITSGTGPTPVDRRLATEHDDVNQALWTMGGYASPPSIAEMIDDVGG